MVMKLDGPGSEIGVGSNGFVGGGGRKIKGFCVVIVSIGAPGFVIDGRSNGFE